MKKCGFLILILGWRGLVGKGWIVDQKVPSSRRRHSSGVNEMEPFILAKDTPKKTTEDEMELTVLANDPPNAPKKRGRKRKDHASDAIDDNNTRSNIVISLSPKRPRRTIKISSRLADSYVETTLGARETLDSKTSYRVNLFNTFIDALSTQIQLRFDESNVQFFKCFDFCNPQSADFLKYEVGKPLEEKYKLHFTGTLEADSKFAKAWLKDKVKIDEETNTKQVFKELYELKSLIPDVVKFFEIFLSLPVSTASCERCFSAMARVKNFLRNRMTDERLSNLCVLAIEKNETKNIDKDALLEKFINLNHRRLQFK